MIIIIIIMMVVKHVHIAGKCASALVPCDFSGAWGPLRDTVGRLLACNLLLIASGMPLDLWFCNHWPFLALVARVFRLQIIVYAHMTCVLSTCQGTALPDTAFDWTASFHNKTRLDITGFVSRPLGKLWFSLWFLWFLVHNLRLPEVFYGCWSKTNVF